MTNITLIHNDSSKITNLITQLTIQNDSSNTSLVPPEWVLLIIPELRRTEDHSIE